MRTILLAAPVLLLARTAAAAEIVRAPQLVPGNSWTYAQANQATRGSRMSHDVITLVRADKDGIVVEVHAAGTPGPGAERLLGPDWSRVRSVNGRQTVVNQPLAFPMTPGKSWRVAYTEFTPADRRHTREAWDMTMKVSGWDTVEVPAGTFRALKIEGTGTWTADTAASVVVARGRAPNGTEVATAQRNAPTTVSGRFFKTFWYVPEVHRWVKSVEDYYSSDGVRSGHTTADLEGFTLADPHGTAATKPDAVVPKAQGARVHRATPPAQPPHPDRSPTIPLRETRHERDPGGSAL